MPSAEYTYIPRIAIIGAGPASLTFASILTRNSIPYTLYEASPEIRHSGGTLDLHPDGGQAALKEAGLWPQFVQRARPEADVGKIVDLLSGEIYWDENGPDKHDLGESEEDKFGGRPEIDRKDLMEITMENVPPEAMKPGKKLLEVRSGTGEAEDMQYDLCFADGTTERDFDLVVGGDGAWSKVRNLLSNVKPQYSGISAVELWHDDVKSNPWLLDYVGEGSCFSFGDGCAVMAQRQGSGGLRSYACLRVPEGFFDTCGIDFVADKSTARQQLAERYFSHVAPDLRRIIAESKDELIPRKLYELPVDFRWAPRSGVTLIGDAAHVMTPFAGVGVNVGMTDALVLARELVKACKGMQTLDEAKRAYETELFPRQETYMRKTLKGKEGHFVEGGSKKLADHIRQGWAEIDKAKAEKARAEKKVEFEEA